MDQMADELSDLIQRLDIKQPPKYFTTVRDGQRVHVVLNGMLLIHVSSPNVPDLPSTGLENNKTDEEDDQLGGLSIGSLKGGAEQLSNQTSPTELLPDSKGPFLELPKDSNAVAQTSSPKRAHRYLLFQGTSTMNSFDFVGSCDSYEEADRWGWTNKPCHVWDVRNDLKADYYHAPGLKEGPLIQVLVGDALKEYKTKQLAAIAEFNDNSTQTWHAFGQTPDRIGWLERYLGSYKRLSNVRDMLRDRDIRWASAFNLETGQLVTFHLNKFGVSTRFVQNPCQEWFDAVRSSLAGSL